ncbi:hypothetical protein AB0G32_13455 [Streptomyces sp. NPDC023723]|uniref:hypothetical protein n=1 Tax=Streptomyces sp. NPDC023723 TaxID=3154323 RepID=UPI0033E5C2D1
MTTTSHDHRPPTCRPDPLDDRGEPGDLRALVARVFARPADRPRRAPTPSAPVSPPRTET